MPREIEFDREGNIILKVNWRGVLKVLIMAAVVAGAGQLPLNGLTEASRICLMIFVGAAGLWITEAIPPFATATMVIVLSVFLLGSPEGPLGLPRSGAGSYEIFLNPIASPVLVLFFGGFILAVAASKHGLDVRLAKAFIKPFGTEPRMVLLGVILTTGVFSAFMSNTATTAMMIAVFQPVFRLFEGRDPFKKALVLSIPFAANIGGMATLIGTPPNAVAASVLGQLGYTVSFLRWMVVAVPIAGIMLFLLWFILIRVFKPQTDRLDVLFPEKIKLTWDLVVVVATFAVTVFLWLTEPLFHIPSAVVAMLPIMVFTMLGIIGKNDLRNIEWHVLILIAGGLTLGVAMKRTGLSDVFVGYITSAQLPEILLIVLFMLFSVVISNFMSHTAAANIMVPIAVSMTGFSPIVGAVGVALACSMAMSLPISTPPNALAFATQVIQTRDLARYGTLVSLIGIPVIMIVLFLAHLIGIF